MPGVHGHSKGCQLQRLLWSYVYQTQLLFHWCAGSIRAEISHCSLDQLEKMHAT